MRPRDVTGVAEDPVSNSYESRRFVGFLPTYSDQWDLYWASLN